MPRKGEMKSSKDAERQEAATELGRFLRGAPFGEDQGGTELYEDRLAREAEEEKEEDKDNMQESKEPESDGMDGMRALPDLTDEERTTTPVVRGRPGPPVTGPELAGAFTREEDNRQMDVVGSKDMSGFRTEFRRRLREPSGREGRILQKMKDIKPGQARRRLRTQGYEASGDGEFRPRRKFAQFAPVEVTGLNPDEEMSPMGKVVPYYGVPEPTRNPTKSKNKRFTISKSGKGERMNNLRTNALKSFKRDPFTTKQPVRRLNYLF